MILTYNFPCGKLIYLPDGNDDGYSDETEFDYEVTPTQEDYTAFLLPRSGWIGDRENRNWFDAGAVQVIKNLYKNYPDFFDSLEEDDDDFYEFMKERYYDEAMEEYNNEE